VVLIRRQRGQHVARHAGDDEPGAAGGGDALELFEHHGWPIEIDGQDPIWRRHIGREAGGVDHLDDRA